VVADQHLAGRVTILQAVRRHDRGKSKLESGSGLPWRQCTRAQLARGVRKVCASPHLARDVNGLKVLCQDLAKLVGGLTHGGGRAEDGLVACGCGRYTERTGMVGRRCPVNRRNFSQSHRFETGSFWIKVCWCVERPHVATCMHHVHRLTCPRRSQANNLPVCTVIAVSAAVQTAAAAKSSTARNAGRAMATLMRVTTWQHSQTCEPTTQQSDRCT
jgi:hypothetical protein